MSSSFRGRLDRLEAIQERRGGGEPSVVILPVNGRTEEEAGMPPGSVACLVSYPGGRQRSFYARPCEEHLHSELRGIRLTEDGVIDLPPDGVFINEEGHEFERIDNLRDQEELA